MMRRKICSGTSRAVPMSDLEKLKEAAEQQIKFASTLGESAVLLAPIAVAVEKTRVERNTIVLALITRLEAAETLIEAHYEAINRLLEGEQSWGMVEEAGALHAKYRKEFPDGTANQG